MKTLTIQEAKKDAIARLTSAGITFSKVSAKTVSMSDLCQDNPIFVEVYGVTPSPAFRLAFDGLAKPGEGGYVSKIRGVF